MIFGPGSFFGREKNGKIRLRGQAGKGPEGRLNKCRVRDLRQGEASQRNEERSEDFPYLLVFTKGADDCVRVNTHCLPDEFGKENEQREIEDSCANEGEGRVGSFRKPEAARDCDGGSEHPGHDRLSLLNRVLSTAQFSFSSLVKSSKENIPMAWSMPQQKVRSGVMFEELLFSSSRASGS
jgi:hypothetical protein